MPLISRVYDEVVVVGVEDHGEAVLKALHPEHALERHLEPRVSDEPDARHPRNFWKLIQAKADVLELDRTCPAEDLDVSQFRA